MFFGYGGLNRNLIRGLLAVLIIFELYQMGVSGVIQLLLLLPPVILAIGFHEFGHAAMAVHFGDTTPKEQGRYTLNPFKHLDPFGFVLLMFSNIGWGKPVEINPYKFTSNKSRSYCETWIALAGPLMNFVLAILGVVIYYCLYNFAHFVSYIAWQYYLMILIMDFIEINIGLGVFNLVPLPPLDGEKIFRNMMPAGYQNWVQNNYYTLYVIFMILWITNVLAVIVTPIITIIENALYSGVGFLFGLF